MFGDIYIQHNYIYKEIMKQKPDAKVLYVGTKYSPEATLVQRGPQESP